MFNLFSVVNGAVVDTPTSDFTGNAATTQITTTSERLELIFLLIIAFIAGIFAHYIYMKIKEYMKGNFEDNDEGNDESNDKSNDKRE